MMYVIVISFIEKNIFRWGGGEEIAKIHFCISENFFPISKILNKCILCIST